MKAMQKLKNEQSVFLNEVYILPKDQDGWGAARSRKLWMQLMISPREKNLVVKLQKIHENKELVIPIE